MKTRIAIACMAFACVRHLALRTVLQKKERMSLKRIRTALAARQCSIVREASFANCARAGPPLISSVQRKMRRLRYASHRTSLPEGSRVAKLFRYPTTYFK